MYKHLVHRSLCLVIFSLVLLVYNFFYPLRFFFLLSHVLSDLTRVNRLSNPHAILFFLPASCPTLLFRDLVLSLCRDLHSGGDPSGLSSVPLLQISSLSRPLFR